MTDQHLDQTITRYRRLRILAAAACTAEATAHGCGYWCDRYNTLAGVYDRAASAHLALLTLQARRTDRAVM